ncbi:DUF2238 domain-containing protein [Candidatus Giovannonibacteria bacterium]|nr:DUF2238 domain-containing protein [Candidatus Giovannonibacteria bacterium]
MSRYHLFLIFVFIFAWVWGALNPYSREEWLLENYLVFIFVPIVLITGRYFRLSDFSYTLITIFLMLHITGAHFTYEKVPFGYFLENLMGETRNMYDRLVHFAFGFLLAYPIREVFVRITRAKGIWGYYIPFDLTLSLSAIYEIIEWITVRNVSQAAGITFLGAQGDIWDSQKDMFAAALGALLAMLIIFIINSRLNRSFLSELKESFKINGNNSGKTDKSAGDTW